MRLTLLFFAIGLLGSWSQAATPVVLASVREAPLTENIPITGTVTSARSAALSVAVAGLVQQVHVDNGSHVQEGDTLLSLDPELQQALLASSRAELNEAEAALADARRRYEEASTLKATTSIAASEVRSIAAEVTMAEAAVERYRAQTQQQTTQLARHTLKAPFAGVISAKHTEAGEWVDPGTAVLALVDTDHLRIDFAVPQEAFRRLDNNARIELMDANTTVPIQTVVPVSDPASRSFLLRAAPLAGDWMPGMSVKARVWLSGEQTALQVPNDALVRYPDGRVSVWLAATEDGVLIARERFIRVASGRGTWIAVLDGLEAGSQVVVRGNEYLSNGQPLQPRNATTPNE